MGTTEKSSKENFSFSPAPSRFGDSCFLRRPGDGAVPGNAANQGRTPFLQEAKLLEAGTLCNFFALEGFELKDGTIKLDAEISMVQQCRDIKMRAKLYDVTDQEKLLITFDVQEKDDCNEMHYVLDQPLSSSVAAASDRELEIVVDAEWEDESGNEDGAAISESAEYDLAEWTVARPKVETEGYVTYPGGTVTKRTRTGSDDKIVLALYRTPDQGTNDLDYLCQYGKSGNQPLLMVPGEGTVKFTDSDFQLESGSAEMYCYLLKPNGGGAYLTAAGDAEYQMKDIDITEMSRAVAYSMYNEWGCTFMEAGDNKKHEYIYHIDLIYKRKGKNRKRHIYLKDDPTQTGPNFGYVPHLLIQWGCLEEHTRIWMADGTRKEIREIARGDGILLPDGQTASAGTIWHGDEDGYYRIRTADGREIKASATHPFLTAGGFKAAKDLVPGQDALMVWEEADRRMKEEAVAEAEKMEGVIKVYNISLGGRQMIADGIVCGDMELQNHRTEG